MELIQGKGISKGIARGTLKFWKKKELWITMRTAQDLQEEKRRLQAAQKKTLEQLESLSVDALQNSNEQISLLMESSAMFVEDDDFIGTIYRILEEKRCNAEYAVRMAENQLAAIFSSMEDRFMRAREADFRDVAGRLIENLLGVKKNGVFLQRPSILVAEDLPLSVMASLDKEMVLGIILKRGTETSHTVILAKTMGIPTVIGIGDQLKEEYEDTTVLLDGETGQIILDPDEDLEGRWKNRAEKEEQDRFLLKEMKGKPDQTLDGRAFWIYCNVHSVDDLDAVLSNDAHGIGLFRSEAIFLESESIPSEEQQFLIYKQLAETMRGKDVYIRTLDLGADKQVDYLCRPEEDKYAWGFRGVRISLEQPELFRTQLRAIYRASAYGRIAILFPMITSVWEVKECKKVCLQVMDELEETGISFDRSVKIGIMIETPAAALIAGDLAKEADFFSIGTNDLIQYLLACDRDSNLLEKYYDSHHPAVLRILKMVADAAQEAGIPVGICGELGADESLLDTFLRIGINGVSVPASEILSIRAQLRKMMVQSAELKIE